MNNINVSNISDPNVQQPFLGPSLQFLQGAFKDSLKGAILRIIGKNYSTSKVYILSGCINSAVLPSYNISAGYIFFNGEIYFCPAISGTVPGGETLYSAVALTYATSGTPDPVTGVGPDPSQFSDGSSFNVHEVRQWKIQPLTTGSGANDFSLWIPSGDIITSSTSNGLTITADNVSGTFSYGTDVYSYTYYINDGICYLSFKITFTVGGIGAIIDKLRIPLPNGITKDTTFTETNTVRGFWAWRAPGGTTDYCTGFINAVDDGTEGQRLVLYRNDASKDITASNVATEIRGQINFPIV